MENISNNPYLFKIILTIITVVTKLIVGFILKAEKDYKGILIVAYYFVPLSVIIWLNIDNSIENSKLTSTLISLNIGLIIFNYLQTNITEQYKIVSQYGKIEKEKIKEINVINNTQAEKMKGIANNQNYILKELSNINDRIIKYIFETKK